MRSWQSYLLVIIRFQNVSYDTYDITHKLSCMLFEYIREPRNNSSRDSRLLFRTDDTVTIAESFRGLTWFNNNRREWNNNRCRVSRFVYSQCSEERSSGGGALPFQLISGCACLCRAPKPFGNAVTFRRGSIIRTFTRSRFCFKKKSLSVGCDSKLSAVPCERVPSVACREFVVEFSPLGQIFILFVVAINPREIEAVFARGSRACLRESFD